ncbi:MAG: NADH-quinone oxidoreductase subunit NuoH [Thermomicrobia bacterium]|nr:NADH-quinone oxidoreductase subunit NuoH [Thermomicrobia bacterium]
MNVTGFVQALVGAVIVMLVAVTAAAYMTLIERRLLARFQVRLGPNRVGPFGFLQPLADAVKLVFKGEFTPMGADPFVYRLAPIISLVLAVSGFALIPIGTYFVVGGHRVPLVLANVSVGLLILLAFSSLGVYGIVLGGWGSGSKYSLLGSLRSTAQIISYELPLGLALASVMLLAGTTRLTGIVDGQSPIPYIVVLPVAFVIYLMSAVAEVNRAPFDLPEAETELVAGYLTEYAGFRWSLYFLAEYVNMLTVSAIATICFLGGWKGPFLSGPLWFAIKMAVFVFLFVWLRATLPRIRYDRLMRLGWDVLLPLAIVNLMVTALIVGIVK